MYSGTRIQPRILGGASDVVHHSYAHFFWDESTLKSRTPVKSSALYDLQ